MAENIAAQDQNSLIPTPDTIKVVACGATLHTRVLEAVNRLFILRCLVIY